MSSASKYKSVYKHDVHNNVVQVYKVYKVRVWHNEIHLSIAKVVTRWLQPCTCT